MVSSRQELGRAGEDAALCWYLERGYRLVERNWRCRSGEVDLILVGHDVLVFCEVKTRTSEAFGGAFGAVGPDKQRRVRRIATRYLASSATVGSSVRFDVAGVRRRGGGFVVDVIEAAF